MIEESFVLDPREWITGPFTTCPFCGGGEFGTLMINARSYVKRCRDCMRDQQYPLPRLEKKLLYLDQFAVSNLMKVVHPEHRTRIQRRGGPEEAFWLELFDRIERLTKLQALVCPWSDAHWEESFVDGRFPQLRRIYEHFASEVRFDDPPTVKHGQVLHAFERWLGDETDPSLRSRGELTRRDVLERSADGWVGKLQVQARLDPGPDVADDLRETRAQRHHGLTRAAAIWREGGRRGFRAYFEEEVAGYGEHELQSYAQGIQAALDLAEGRRELDADAIFPARAQILIQTMREKLSEHGIAREEHVGSLREFFGSEVMQEIPFLRISAGMLAALAVTASLHQAPEPNQGLATDINVVSTYLPYCDAIFIDGGCAALLTDADRELAFGYTSEVFTPNSRGRLLEWLTTLEGEVSEGHKALVERVYGPSWLEPYRTIFECDQGSM